MSNPKDGRSKRDRRLDELTRIEFTGSMTQALASYAHALKTITQRWDTELELSAVDARRAILTMRGSRLRLDKTARRVRARRVTRRLKRARVLAAGLTKQAEALPREYARQFLQGDRAPRAQLEEGDL